MIFVLVVYKLASLNVNVVSFFCRLLDKGIFLTKKRMREREIKITSPIIDALD